MFLTCSTPEGKSRRWIIPEKKKRINLVFHVARCPACIGTGCAWCKRDGKCIHPFASCDPSDYERNQVKWRSSYYEVFQKQVPVRTQPHPFLCVSLWCWRDVLQCRSSATSLWRNHPRPREEEESRRVRVTEPTSLRRLASTFVLIVGEKKIPFDFDDNNCYFGFLFIYI